MRWAELGLFVAPFALYAVWRWSSEHARASLLWGIWAVVAILVAGTVWFGLSQRLGPGQSYVPAQWQNGRVVPGHGVARQDR